MTADAILAYHQRTKHHFKAFARGPGHLDWDTQPDPFRTYAGAPLVELPLVADANATPYASLFEPGAVSPRQLALESIAGFFELALGLSAWKEFRGNRWALRCDPSSGNLHPTEAYALIAACAGIPAGLYHYVSRDHVLERRWTPDDPAALAALLPAGGFAVLLTSIHWRESWKYGERAFRYCQHDAGHCIATVRYSAAAHGWSARLIEDPADSTRAALCGLDRLADHATIAVDDREHPDALIAIAPSTRIDASATYLTDRLPALVELLRTGTWAGTPNELSPSHAEWSAIDDAAEATEKPLTVSPSVSVPVSSHSPPATGHPPLATGLTAATLIRARRSAVAMDGTTFTDRTTLERILAALLPRANTPPWDALPWPPHVHPALFVHRVKGFQQGLYLLERAPGFAERFRAACTEPFAWEPASDAVPLHLLATGDTRNAARAISCHQEIASDGAFSLGMIADFSGPIRERGPWFWRRLFWESGVLGHVLYLECEANGLRGTGIGCYFDDGFHEIFGLRDDRYQSLYHFTAGGAVEDARLQTHPPYAHLPASRRTP